MTVRMGLISKKADWTWADFNAYWRDEHGALARRAPLLREYWQNPVVERLQRGIDFARGPWELDGFSQLAFDDAQQSHSAFGSSPIAAALVKDEQHFLGQLHIVTAEQNVIIPVPTPQERRKLLKRMSLIKRLPSMSEADFRREWQHHGELVRQMEGVRAYRQNVIVARERIKGQPCAYEELPIDGIVEMWFEDAATLEAAFRSEAGSRTMAHAKSFLSEITAFVVAERQIL